MVGFFSIVFLDDNKLSSHMSQISEHLNYTNQKIHSYYQINMMVFNLGINKVKNNYNPYH